MPHPTLSGSRTFTGNEPPRALLVALLAAFALGCGAATGSSGASGGSATHQPASEGVTVEPVRVTPGAGDPVATACAPTEASTEEAALLAQESAWDPVPTSTVLLGLLAVWPERLADEDAPETLGTALVGGLHRFYNVAVDQMSLRALDALMGVPVFAEGPHGAHPDVRNTESFGRYDPRFLARSLRVIAELERRDAITPDHRATLRENVTLALRTLLAVRDEIDSQGGMSELVQMWREAGGHFLPPGGPANGAWRESPYATRESAIYDAVWDAFAVGDEEPDDTVTNGVGFWIRRELNGNADLMRRALQRAACLVDGRYR